MTAAGQVTVTVGLCEGAQRRASLLREALARNQEEPQILRSAALSGRIASQDLREIGDELSQLERTHSEFCLLPGSAANSKGHRWSLRVIYAWATMEAFRAGLEYVHSHFGEVEVLNAEIKILVRLRPEALLSPVTITDRDVFLAYTDEKVVGPWGIALQGRQYVALFARWFDDRWSAIPDSYVIYSRNGLNQKAVDRIRKELEAAEVAGKRRTA
jgi:hypothetical protein